MALRNLNFDSAIRGILEQRTVAIDGLLTQASEQLVKCNLSADLGKAVTSPRLVRRGPQKGQHVGSENFNPRSIGEWIENVPADADSDEVKQAHVQLVALHATLATRSPQTWAKLQAAQKADKPQEPSEAK